MPAVPIKSRQRHLRLFFSAELDGGSAFKNRRPVEEFSQKGAWTDRFEQFLRDFSMDFKAEVKRAREEEATRTEATIVPPPSIWKIHGDALLFTELAYPDEEQGLAVFRTAVGAFVRVAQQHDEELMRDNMGLRGCVWTAGFPIRNRRVQLVQDDVEFFIDDDARDRPVPIVESWIGRDMDLGLRLCGEAQSGRVTCSLDVGHFMMLAQPCKVKLYCVGWRQFPEVLGGVMYPLLWLEPLEPRGARQPWDIDQSPEFRALSFKGALDKEQFDLLAMQMRRRFPQLISPYMASGNMPNQARKVHEAKESIHAIRILGSTTERGLDVSAPPGRVSLMNLDDLNQILVDLQEKPQKAASLRKVLMAIATDRSYRTWLYKDQYDGRLFKLHPELVGPVDKDFEHRLPEAMHLVADDILRVKLIVRGEQVLITDGLWVPASIQVFPFEDESDLILDQCGSDEMRDFPADCIIDVATRCGYNALGYASETHVRRYGFDRSARAIVYAAINALINDVPDFTAGVRRVQQGIARVFDASRAENVLVTVNMPFALVPTVDTIALANDGGKLGYEKTMEALRQTAVLAEHLHPKSEMRAVVLVYSLGRKDSDSWYVPTKAREIFGEELVTWRLLDKPLWRINGRKEEPNPMLLSKLKNKAECRFHVRNDANRQAVKKDYEVLTRKLRRMGFTHVAYGMLTIRGLSREWALSRPTVAD